MHRAWVVVLAGCGFQSKVAPGGDATMDASSSDANPGICWKLSDKVYKFDVSACPTALADMIDVTTDVAVDTDAGTSNPPGLTCAPLASGSSNVCALAASTIKIEPGAILSAHGSKPLALIGHSIDIEGTIDVAGHVGAGVAAGGGAGAIRVATGASINISKMSPTPVMLMP